MADAWGGAWSSYWGGAWGRTVAAAVPGGGGSVRIGTAFTREKYLKLVDALDDARGRQRKIKKKKHKEAARAAIAAAEAALKALRAAPPDAIDAAAQLRLDEIVATLTAFADLQKIDAAIMQAVAAREAALQLMEEIDEEEAIEMLLLAS